MLRIKSLILTILVTFFYLGGNAQIPDTLDIALLLSDSIQKEQDRFNQNLLLPASDFNQGHITDPWQLLQGKSPSLLIARTGNDPNGYFDYRMRGIKSFDVTEPLIVINGIPVSSLDGIHPNDIGSVEVLTNGTDAALYGLRGSNGILSIQTKRGEAGKFKLSYQTYLAYEKLKKKPDVLSAAGFRSIGGYDLGSSTDWWEEITRKAISQRHSLSLSGGTAQSNYYASLHYDDVNGIAIGSAYKRYNSRLFFEQKGLNDRLTIYGGIASSYRKSNLTPPIAFWHATSFNPTAPVYSEDPEFERYGGYFERVLFRNYNPVSLLEQNKFFEEYQHVSLQFNAEFELMPGLSASIQYGNEEEDRGNSMFSQKTSFYLGMFRHGLAQQVEAKKKNHYLSSGLAFSREWEAVQLNAGLQYRHQDQTLEILDVRGGDFLTDAFSFDNFSAANDFKNGLGTANTQKVRHSLEGLSGHLNMVLKEKYFMSANLTREGSSRLGTNKKRGLFYGANVGIWLNDQLSIRTAYSKTGNLPGRSFLAQELHQRDNEFYYNGDFHPGYKLTQEGNPDLKWEETKEWNLGVDFTSLSNRLNASLDYYSSRSGDLVMRLGLDRQINLGSVVYRNQGAVKNAGLEFRLNYELFRKANFNWQFGVNGAKYAKTKLLDYFSEEYSNQIKFIGGLGGGRRPVIQLKEGKPLGEIWGYRLHPTRKVSPDGSWNRIDQNNDGYFSIEDYVLVGNALPKASLGITNRLDWGKVRVDFLLRGVFGHDLVNFIKSFHSTPVLVNAYNVLRAAKTELRDLQDYPDFTDRDVEKASYLRLDYLAINYDIKLEKWKGFDDLQVYITAQNLFTITSYTGLDPEIRLEDRNILSPFDHNYSANPDDGDPLVPGMDRQNTYPLSRTFVIGLKCSL